MSPVVDKGKLQYRTLRTVVRMLCASVKYVKFEKNKKGYVVV